MKEQFSRTELLIGTNSMLKLNNSHIAVFGVGGVGGYVVESLSRSGIGKFDIIDNDIISLSNINRQIIATLDTVGKYKTEVIKERILSINNDCIVNIHNTFVLPENIDTFDFSSYDYVIDCVDTVSAKIALIEKCNSLNIPIISCMGTGNKMNPQAFEVTDIYKTSVCPLARVLRHELKKRKIPRLKVVYSKEEPIKINLKEEKTYENEQEKNTIRRSIPASNAFVPASAGLLISSEVIKDLTKKI